MLLCYSILFLTGWESALPTYKPTDAALATRQSSQQVLAKVCTYINTNIHTYSQTVATLSEVIGGSADLTPSTLTQVDGNKVDFNHHTPEGRYVMVWYGIVWFWHNLDLAVLYVYEAVYNELKTNIQAFSYRAVFH